MNTEKSTRPIDLQKDRVSIPVSEHPEFITAAAFERGCETNLLFTTWGGLGDQLCSEPTLRFAIDTFHRWGAKVSLASEFPEMFSHLNFDNVYDTKKVRPIYENYLTFHTIKNPHTLLWQFVSHCVTHCVDFPAICSLRCTLPIEYKAIESFPEKHVSQSFKDEYKELTDNGHVFVHAGKHWPSKTFPKDWWDRVLASLKVRGFTPVIIGKDMDDNRGTVDTDTTGCIDLRNRTKLSETMWLMKNAQLVVTSDSSPLHMAAIGKAHVAFVATAKHQDYIAHWRRDMSGIIKWYWRQKHFNTGGMWDIVDMCPNKKENVLVDVCEEEQLRKWLPEPTAIPEWIEYVSKNPIY